MNSNPLLSSTWAHQRISTLTVLAYTTTTLPQKLLQESVWEHLLSDCRLNAPLLVNGDRYEGKMREVRRKEAVVFGVRAVQKHIQDIGGCAKDIGLELQNIFHSEHAVIYIVHQDGDEDVKLNKYSILGPVKMDSDCPDKASHARTEFLQSRSYPAGWSAERRKCLRINDQAQLEKECGSFKRLHSFGCCLVKNMMCVYVRDQTNDMSLVIELSNKIGGYTEHDEEDAKLFSQLVGYVLSSSVMLEHRRNAILRSDITNKVVNNISKVHYNKVSRLLDFQFRSSIYFTKRFYTMRFTFTELPREQYAGVILFMFTELGFIKRWKMRKATVIRFILSLGQGYIENPYHNWKHACTVAHYAFLLLKKMDLQNHGYLTDLEALALIVACLCHDIGHRGLNNHFSVFVDKDANHLQSQETSLAERHHVALSLQILSSEECNIVENMTDAEYTEFIELVQFTIIATDLSKHLTDRHDQFKILKKFARKKKDHRRAFLSLLMTACDMSETLKPWDDYILTVKNIFFEFFEQGDEELRLGHTPTPIMDKRIAYIPYIELKFLDEICRPVYDAIAELLPRTEESVQKIDYFKELWLIATKVFDDHVLNPNPLYVLTHPDMKETCLKSEVNLELEKTVFHMRKTQPKEALQSQLNPAKKKGRLKRSLHRIKSFGSNDFRRTLQSWCCCGRCRHKALYNAEYVRRMKYETKFMEERSDGYEKIRMTELYPGEFTDEINPRDPRDKVDNLINPNAEKVKGAVVEKGTEENEPQGQPGNDDPANAKLDGFKYVGKYMWE